MGGGSYSYISSRSRADRLSATANSIDVKTYACMDSATKSVYAAKSSSFVAQNTFTQRSLDPEMNINGKVRESCDSEEHPESFPIIIALDVTGSMSTIPAELISDSFPEIMKSVMDANVEHAQVCFVGVGDDIYDRCPIQVGQFETSDELTEKWLKKLYLEGGGGGNFGEAYALAWYVAARHTKIDSFEKRNKKGVLITIGDEPCLKMHSRHTIKSLFGDDLQGDIISADLFKEVSEKWDVYHIDAGRCSDFWESQFPGIKILKSGRTINSIASNIVKAIVTSYKGNTLEYPHIDTTSEEKEDIIL